MSRGALVTYAGYPYTPGSLMPDNGLAGLAGTLFEAGHEAVIMDYNTVSSIARMIPAEHSARLKAIYAKLGALKDKSKPARVVNGYYLFKQLAKLEKVLAKHQEAQVAGIAEEISSRVEKEKLDFVGFKLWMGDGFEASVQIAEALKKKFPHLKIYAGGPQVDIAKGVIYRRTKAFDALVYSDGEEALTRLAACPKDLRAIPNLIYRENGNIRVTEKRLIQNLDEIAIPVYDSSVYPAMKGDQKIKFMILDESRGCPNGCAFCFHPVKSGSVFRSKSIGRVYKEIKTMTEDYDVYAFRYAGSTTPPQLISEIARLLIKNRLPVSYVGHGHLRMYDAVDFRLLKESGLYSMLFGVESGDEEILKTVMQKNTTPEQMSKTLKSAMDAGIYSIGTIIYPAPFETERSKQKTKEMILNLFRNYPELWSIQVFFPVIHPEAKWGKEPEKYGFRLLGSTEEVLYFLLNYRIKNLFSPSFWKPMPFTVNGKSFKTVSKETESFAKEIEAQGVLAQMSDDLALMAKLYGVSVKEFRELIRVTLFSGDHEAMQEVVGRINADISAPARVGTA